MQIVHSFSKSAQARFLAATIALLGTGVAMSAPITLQVTVNNLSPNDGTLLTPLWFGVHDGTFDLYDRGAPISAELERLAEDGNTAPLVGAFGAAPGGFVDGVIFGSAGPIPPVTSASETVTFDFGANPSAFFSYASMVIPSNDAFIANGNPTVHSLFDSAGEFVGLDFIVFGTEVLDAGSEVNDEIPENTAALAQTVPDTGVAENGTIELHPGFIPGGNVLTAIPNGDFTQDEFQVVRIRVEQVDVGQVPAPAIWLLLGVGALAWVTRGQQPRIA